jgi:REP element-mobilizing transposase RayT
LRIQFPGAFYHITSRGNERKDIYKSNADREKFLSYLESAVCRYQAAIHAYCLMSNHFHLLIETPAGNLSQIMQHIIGAYTNYYNIKRNRSGHLFQGRFKALLVDADAYAKELSRYIHLNPVRAGIVDRPGEYPWSSFRAYVGESNPPQWLNRDLILGYFGGITTESQTAYRRFAWETAAPSLKSPLDDVIASTFLGGRDFIEKIKSTYLTNTKRDRDLPAIDKISEKTGIEAIVLAAESQFGSGTALSKQAALFLCHQYSGKTLGEIGRYFDIGDSGVSQASRRFLEKVIYYRHSR